MTDNLLWIALYLFIALVLLAVIVRALKRLWRRDEPRGPHRRSPRE